MEIKLADTKKLYSLFVLIGLWLFYAINNYFVLLRSNYILGPDSASYLEGMFKIHYLLAGMKIELLSLRVLWTYLNSLWKPPLYYLTGSLPLFFTDNQNLIIISNNLIYFAVLLFSLYGIGNKLKNKSLGLLSAFLMAMFPTTFALSRVLMMDFALASMVSLTYYMFLINRFQSLLFSLICGIVIALGALTKHTYPVFISPILIYSLTENARNRNFSDSRFRINFFISILLGLIAAFIIWYWNNLRFRLEEVHYVTVLHSPSPPYFYLESMFKQQLGPVFSLLFIAAFIFSIYKRDYFWPGIITIFFFICSISHYKAERYILPVYIFISLMISRFILTSIISRKGMVVFISYCILNFFFISYGNFLPDRLQGFLNRYLFYFNQQDASNNWLEKGLYRKIQESATAGIVKSAKIIIGEIMKNKIKPNVRIFQIVADYNLDSSLRLLIARDNLDIDTKKMLTENELRRYPVFWDSNFLIGYISKFDFIIIEEEIMKNTPYSKYFLDAFEKSITHFDFVSRIESNNKDSILHAFTLYKRKQI